MRTQPRGFSATAQRVACGGDCQYLNTEGNSISVNIVLSAQPEAELVHVRENKSISYQRVVGAFVILDGSIGCGLPQVRGPASCPRRHLRRAVAARRNRIFVDIKDQAPGVPKSLILDVKGLAGSESDDEKLRPVSCSIA